MPWEEAIDRHRHRVATELAKRREPWTAAMLQLALAEATQQLVELQATVLDCLDEGALDEDASVRGLARLLDGIELETALERPLEWIAEAAPPRLVEPPRLRDPRALRHRWERAQRVTAKPVKLSLLGPRSFAGMVDDALHGTDVDAGAAAVAEALNPGLRALGEAGCPAVELVEPALLAATPRATMAGFEAVARALYKVSSETQRWLRLVPADAIEPWLGAPPPALNVETIADVLEELPIDGVILTPEAALAEPAVLERWRRLKLGLVVIPADANTSFRADEALGALAIASARLQPGRLAATIDGGGAAARLPLRERLGLLEGLESAMR